MDKIDVTKMEDRWEDYLICNANEVSNPTKQMGYFINQSEIKDRFGNSTGKYHLGVKYGSVYQFINSRNSIKIYGFHNSAEEAQKTLGEKEVMGE